MRIADAFSWLRILIGIALYVPAFQGQRVLFVLGFLAAGLTDLLDGLTARRWGRTSFGSALDGWADRFIFASATVWMWWLAPDVLAALWPFLVLFGLLEMASRISQYRKFRTITGYHLLSGKVAAFLGYVFITVTVLAGYIPALWYALVLSILVNFVEEFTITIRSKKYTPNRISAFLR